MQQKRKDRGKKSKQDTGNNIHDNNKTPYTTTINKNEKTMKTKTKNKSTKNNNTKEINKHQHMKTKPNHNSHWHCGAEEDDKRRDPYTENQAKSESQEGRRENPKR